MNVNKYLQRIGYTETSKPDIETLKDLHKRQLFNIPFENLDIHIGRKIVLDENLLEKKIIDERRGGYCYELNGLFYFFLKALGYKVKMISARVNNGNGGWGEEFDHLALMVDTEDGQWLADVGFGDNFIEPVKFEIDAPVKQTNGFYKITKHRDDYFLLSKSTDGEKFTDEYIFTTEERRWNEFSGMNDYHQTSAESHFTKRKVCTIPNEQGRITLSSDKLTITTAGGKHITGITDDKNFNEALYKYFNIKI